MSNFLMSLSKVVHASLALAVLLFLFLFFNDGGIAIDTIFWSWLQIHDEA